MADLTDPVETGMPRSVRFGIAAVVILILFAWFLPRRAGNKNGATPPGTPTAAGSSSTSDRETEQQLSAILKGLSPELVAISNDRLDRVTELSQWAGEALAKGDAAAVTVDENANQKWFSGDALKEVSDPSFSPRDGHHLTMAALAGEIVTRLSQRTSEPLEQIDELFQFVIRETMLAPDALDQQLPGTAFESLLIGRATAASRAWAFGILLRPLRIDAVILEPKSKPEAWIIGVISPAGDVLLYDPRLGTSIPSESSPAGFQKPATLALVREKPDLLHGLDVPGVPYPLGADDLKAFNVRLITDSSASSQRMAKLQTMITASMMEVFDGIGKSPLREQGLAERIIAAGQKAGWTEADVAVWSYPEQQANAFMSQGAEEAPAWKGISQVFAGPVTLTQVRKQTRGESESATETVVQKSKEPLRLVRVWQLQGKVEQALQRYLPIRTAPRGLSRSPDPELQAKFDEARPLNLKTADFATFWTAACQAQLNPRLTPRTLSDYIRDFPRGEMLPAVPELWATSLVLAGQQQEAVQLLEGGSSKTPRQEILLKQWKAAPPPVKELPPQAAPAEVPAESQMPPEKTEPAPPGDDRPPAPPEAT